MLELKRDDDFSVAIHIAHLASSMAGDNPSEKCCGKSRRWGRKVGAMNFPFLSLKPYSVEGDCPILSKRTREVESRCDGDSVARQISPLALILRWDRTRSLAWGLSGDMQAQAQRQHQ